MTVVGWLLIVVGVLFLLLAFAAAARKWAETGSLESAGEGGGGGAIEALTALLAELGKLPKWMLAALLGVLLIITGTLMVSGDFNKIVASYIEAPATPDAEPK